MAKCKETKMAKCTANLEDEGNKPSICVYKTDRSSPGMIEDGPILCDHEANQPECEYFQKAQELARAQRRFFQERR